MSDTPKFMRRVIKVKLDDPKLAPFRAHASDAGADLFSKETLSIVPGEQGLVDTGVAIKIPLGHVGFIFNRSSQGKQRIQIANGTGVIDSDYRGTIRVLLRNDSEVTYNIVKYETRIAQLVIVPIVLGAFEQWNENDGLWNDTERGTGGFGSTGT